jgi:hypothetical protein
VRNSGPSDKDKILGHIRLYLALLDNYGQKSLRTLLVVPTTRSFCNCNNKRTRETQDLPVDAKAEADAKQRSETAIESFISPVHWRWIFNQKKLLADREELMHYRYKQSMPLVRLPLGLQSKGYRDVIEQSRDTFGTAFLTYVTCHYR